MVFRALGVCQAILYVLDLMLSRATQVEMKAAFLLSRLTTELKPHRYET